MSWTFTFHLFPDEKIVDDSPRRTSGVVTANYSVFLTDKRAIFRFDGFGSSLSKAFFYSEIEDVRLIKRVFMSYLCIISSGKEFLLNVENIDYWTKRIKELKELYAGTDGGSKSIGSVSSVLRTKRELMDMLTILKKQGLLTDEEFETKVGMLESLDVCD